MSMSSQERERRLLSASFSRFSNTLSQGCYVDEDVKVSGAKDGPLRGFTAVIKDSYDVAGHLTRNGSPDWARTHPLPKKNADAVQALLDAGASIVGKTIMDEMAYSLEGENFHYGTPTNPACPGRIPGGSSSGSAAAVAAGDADFGLGGDTGGSVRVPASYCGIYGIRPTHGRVSLVGQCPLAPSFDTGGWFARDPDMLIKVGNVLLAESGDCGGDSDGVERSNETQRKKSTSIKGALNLKRWLVGMDAFDVADKDANDALYSVVSQNVDRVKELLGFPEEIRIANESIEAPDGVSPDEAQALHTLDGWREVFRVHQAFEIWSTHGRWIESVKPNFGPGIKERFEAASKITYGDFEKSRKLRHSVRSRMKKLLGDDGVLMMPTAVSCAPFCNTPPSELDAFRSRALRLTSIAGLSGFPEVTLPVAKIHGCPIGLSLIAPPWSDESLLELAKQLAAVMIAN